jgi:hypothetical protein
MSMRLTRAVSIAAMLFVASATTQGALAQAGPRPSLAPLAGKFRVSIDGFTVNSQTRDHILDVDGVGDEVFVSVNVIVADSARNLVTPQATLESKVYGEKRRDITGKFVWPDRSAFGSGTRMGGLKSGNIVPNKEPWKRTAQPSAFYMPMEVWCGTLTQGQNAVVIVPSIWEWDGVSSTFGEWVNWANSLVNDLAKNKAFMALIGKKGSPIVLGTQLTLGAAVRLDSTGLVGGERDRPIGVTRSTRVPKTYEFTPPHKIVLNYETADFFVRDGGAGALGAAAPGVQPLIFVDDPFFQGRYTIYVHIERIDGGQCSHEYVPTSTKKPDSKP